MFGQFQICFVKNPLENQAPNLPITQTRRNALRLISAGVIGSLVDGCWLEPSHLSISRQDITCRQLPAGLDGLRIGLLADFHYRPNWDSALMDKVVAQVGRENLDLITLAGDFMSKDPRVIPPLLSHIGKMQARHGVFAVLGNHDGWNVNPAWLQRQFEKVGVSFLINQHRLLSIRGESLVVAGSDFVWFGAPDPAKMLKGVNADMPVLALVHEPDYFDTLTRHREIQLQVSGHTHGGQCRVPLVDYAPKTVKYGSKYVYGSFRRGDSNLFVTRGVGTTGPRVRFACPPELAVLTLRATPET